MLKDRMYGAVFALPLLACVSGQALGAKDSIVSNIVTYKGQECRIVSSKFGKFSFSQKEGGYWKVKKESDIPLWNSTGAKNLGTPVSITLSPDLQKVGIGYNLDNKTGSVIELQQNKDLFYSCISNSLKPTDHVPKYLKYNEDGLYSSASSDTFLWITSRPYILAFSAVAAVGMGVGAYLLSKKKSNKSEDDSFEQEAE